MASLLTWWVTGMIMSDVAGGMAEGTDDVAVSADVADTMTWRSAWQDLLTCLMT
jgi:hypothetical protein